MQKEAEEEAEKRGIEPEEVEVEAEKEDEFVDLKRGAGTPVDSEGEERKRREL
jgi:hypothetical protein